MGDRVVVLGLDGGTWRLIDELIEKGKMENIKKLKKNGKFCKMMSSIPPTTFPAWKCYSTGKNPGKLGVFGMFHPNFKQRKMIVPNSRSFKSREFWDVIGDEGFKVGIINMPTTEPVKRVNGFMIGGPFSSFSGFTYPIELEKEIVKKYDYRTFLEELVINRNRDDLLDQVKKIISTRFNVLEESMKEGKYHFLHATIFHIDTMQHFMWGTKTLEEAWSYIDKRIGRIVELLGDEWTLFLMSDHGFTKTGYKFYVNNWFQQRELLRMKSVKGFIGTLGIRRGGIYGFLKKTGMITLLKRIFTIDTLRKIARSIPNEDGTMEIESLEDMIDWENTIAINNNYGIYLNVKNDVEKKDMIEKIIRDLKKIKGPDGAKPIKQVIPCDELYWGKHIQDSPDLHIICKEQYEPKSTITGSGELFSDETMNPLGHHLSDGIFLAYGANISSEPIKGPISIFDIAPTILDLLKKRIPRDMDGKVIGLGTKNKVGEVGKCA
jgi:predicted AlkP superfamily phosphohydrolase/phosphomutase